MAYKVTDMNKLISVSTAIVERFFNNGVAVDRQICPEFVKGARGILFMRVFKVGFIWTGNIGGGIIMARLPDGSWSPPTAIAQGGVGFGADVGGEMTDFMIILGTDKAVETFKKNAQIQAGAGLDIALGPYGRVAQANVQGSAAGLGVNYTYSFSKGLYAGIGIRLDGMLSQTTINKNFYPEADEITPRSILNGQNVPPDGACDRLWDALRLAESGEAYSVVGVPTATVVPEPPSIPSVDMNKVQQMVDMGVERAWCPFALRMCNGDVHQAIDYCFRHADILKYMNLNDNSIPASSIDSPPRAYNPNPASTTNGTPFVDPRLAPYESESQIWRRFQATQNTNQNTSREIEPGNDIPSPTNSPSNTSFRTMQNNNGNNTSFFGNNNNTSFFGNNNNTSFMGYSTAPTDNTSLIISSEPIPVEGCPPCPPGALRAEHRELYVKILTFVDRWIPRAEDVAIFKSKCKSVGKMELSVEDFSAYLKQTFARPALLQLMNDLVRLMPNDEMRVKLWVLIHRE